jgi:hypothetical protein
VNILTVISSSGLSPYDFSLPFYIMCYPNADGPCRILGAVVHQLSGLALRVTALHTHPGR